MCRSAAACLLGSLVRIPLEAWLFAFWYLLCVGSGLCDELITSSEEFYRVCVCVSSTNINNVAAYARCELLRHRQRILSIYKFPLSRVRST
jgi:hypothetical protein